MKATILGKLDPKVIPVSDRQVARSLCRRSDKRWLGEVEPIGLEIDNPYMQALLGFAAKFGFKYKPNDLYTGPCLLPLDGTVLWHDDGGIGHILNWVLEVKAYGGNFATSRDTPALLSQYCGKVNQIDSLDAGTVFVFNGDVGHAWLSNESCVLAQVTVSVPRGEIKVDPHRWPL